MPWPERRGERFRIKFRYASKNRSVPLKTADKRVAEGHLGRCKENLRLLERSRLELPDGADPGLFLLSDGKLAGKPAVAVPRTIEGLFALYDE